MNRSYLGNWGHFGKRLLSETTIELDRQLRDGRRGLMMH